MMIVYGPAISRSETLFVLSFFTRAEDDRQVVERLSAAQRQGVADRVGPASRTSSARRGIRGPG